MIQRIQSVFLALTGLALLVTLFLPLWQKVDPEKREAVTVTSWALTHTRASATGGEVDEVLKKESIVYVGVVTLVAACIAFFSVFQYKNRLRQIMLGALNSLLVGAAMLGVLLNSGRMDDSIAPDAKGVYLLAFYLFLAALIFNNLANRFIRRDERLVKDSGRLR